MKIKTFNSFLNDAETAINKFLEGKTYVDIKTDTVVHNNKVFTQYTVVYEDGDKNEEVPVQMPDGITTYTRPKGSDEPFQRVMSVHSPTGWMDLNENGYKVAERIKNRNEEI